MKALEQYHYAWLACHTHRTEEWLRAKLVEGFDVHHLDGNHDNNEGDNLVLIEHVDHMRLHGTCKTSLGRLSPKPGKKRKRRKIKVEQIIITKLVEVEKIVAPVVQQQPRPVLEQPRPVYIPPIYKTRSAPVQPLRMRNDVELQVIEERVKAQQQRRRRRG
jgi:hypothetical protein